MQVGDKVNYVPDQVHARQRDRNGDYPWVFGWKTGKRVQDGSGQLVPEVIELSDAETSLKMQHISKQSPGRMEAVSANLVFLRPSKSWSATVTAVDESGEFADLDISDPTTGSTLHYPAVSIDDDKTPHTCHTIAQ